jgi:hypothetical protein
MLNIIEIYTRNNITTCLAGIARNLEFFRENTKIITFDELLERRKLKA